MRFTAIVSCLLLLGIAPCALAVVVGGDFDSQPPGPYTGGATVQPPGSPGVQVVPDNQGYAGAPSLGNGSGNMLRIDNLSGPGPIIVTFVFYCDVIPDNLCRIGYAYAASAWDIYSGFGVYVDDPTLTNPDDLWEPPVGFPPSTVGPGDNHENAGDCDGATHTITFVVAPGTVLHLDNMATECLENPVGDERHSWGALKAWYR